MAPLSPSSVALFTALAMLAFAGNSLLCRLALAGGSIDALSFTGIRLASGAGVLAALVLMRRGSLSRSGNWVSALALLVYAVGFSWAYINLSAAAGALILFGAVQATMMGAALYQGERFGSRQTLGVVIAATGLVVLLLPGWQAPPLLAALVMALAGVAWGVYSLRGRGVPDPLRETAGNFLRATPLAVAMALLGGLSLRTQPVGVLYALASGVLTSGLGYALWYLVLPRLQAATAAMVQLSVPVVAAVGGVLLLAEPITLRLTLSGMAVLGGIAIFIISRARPPA